MSRKINWPKKNFVIHHKFIKSLPEHCFKELEKNLNEFLDKQIKVIVFENDNNVVVMSSDFIIHRTLNMLQQSRDLITKSLGKSDRRGEPMATDIEMFCNNMSFNFYGPLRLS